MLNLIIKDFKNIVYDIKSLMFILVMPIALMSILGMALQGVFSDTMSSEIFSTQIAVVKAYDYDDQIAKVEDTLSSDMYANVDIDMESLGELDPENIFFNQFMDSTDIKAMLNYQIMSQEMAEEKLAAGDIAAYIILPKNYIYNGYMNFLSPQDMRNLTTIEIIKGAEADKDFEVSMVEMVMTAFYGSMDNRIAMNKVAMNVSIINGFDGETTSAMLDGLIQDEIQRYEIPAESVPGSKSVTSFQYYAVAIMAMFIMYSASTGARALFQETREHTFQRMQVGGILMGQMLLSNFFRVMLIVMTQSLLMIMYSVLILKNDWGNPLNQGIVLLLSSFAVAGIGTFIATVSLHFNNVKLANIFEFAVVQMMALFGGSFIPVEVLPKSFQAFSFLSLNASVLGGYLNGMYERPLSQMSGDLLYMGLFGGLFIVLSMILLNFKRRESIA